MKKVIALLLCAVIICSATSCEPRTGYARHSEYCFDYFDTVTEFTAYTVSEEAFESAFDVLTSELERYNKLFDIYNSYDGISNLKTINDCAGEWVSVDPEIIELIEFSKEAHELTLGKTNIAIGAVTHLWKTASETLELPGDSELESASKHTDIDAILVDRETMSVKLEDVEMSLDVGAVAKGFVLSRLANALSIRGLDRFLINFGGSVCAVGEKPDGEEFTSGIYFPGKEISIPLGKDKVVTSGAYMRFFEIDGEKYSHIISTETYRPMCNFYSVSVICPDSALGDALSTALCCMTLDDGKDLVETLQDVEAVWITYDGEIISSK